MSKQAKKHFFAYAANQCVDKHLCESLCAQPCHDCFRPLLDDPSRDRRKNCGKSKADFLAEPAGREQLDARQQAAVKRGAARRRCGAQRELDEFEDERDGRPAARRVNKGAKVAKDGGKVNLMNKQFSRVNNEKWMGVG